MKKLPAGELSAFAAIEVLAQNMRFEWVSYNAAPILGAPQKSWYELPKHSREYWRDKAIEVLKEAANLV